jgi:hypothetical protein
MVICSLCLVSSILFDQLKPLVGYWTIWGKDRIQVMTRNKPSSELMIRLVDLVVPKGDRLGIIPASGDSFEYPLFGRNLKRRLFSVRIDKKDLLSAGKLPDVDYLLFEGERQESFYLDDSDVSRTEFGFGAIDLQPLLAAVRNAGSGWHPIIDIDGFFHLFGRESKEVDTSVLPEFLPGEWNIWADYWVKKEFVVNVRIDPAKPSIQLRGDVPVLGIKPLINVEGPDNEQLAVMQPTAGTSFEQRISLASLLSNYSGKYAALKFTSNLQFNPKKLGQSEDARDLSWRLYEFKLNSDASIRETKEVAVTSLPDALSGGWNEWTDHWVKKEFVVDVRIDPAKPAIQIRGDTPDLGVRPVINVEGPDNKPLATMQPAAGTSFEQRIPLTQLLSKFSGKYATLKFRSNLQFNPKRSGQSEDARDLSWRLYEFKLVAEPAR